MEYLISREEQPLGTGGAIRHAADQFSNEKVLILNGDSRVVFSISDFKKFHKNKKA